MRRAEVTTSRWSATIRLEAFAPADHLLRPIRAWFNEALSGLDATFSAMYARDVKGGRPSIAPEKLMRAMFLRVLYSIRSERRHLDNYVVSPILSIVVAAD